MYEEAFQGLKNGIDTGPIYKRSFSMETALSAVPASVLDAGLLERIYRAEIDVSATPGGSTTVTLVPPSAAT
jgi:hypothetical protein